MKKAPKNFFVGDLFDNDIIKRENIADNIWHIYYPRIFTIFKEENFCFEKFKENFMRDTN